jgi:uncharacterized protein (TIGR00251 family)
MSAPTRIRFRVAPGAARSDVVGRHRDGWKVRVAAAPERGKANDALIGLLAEVLPVGRSDVAVVSGLASRDKIVAVSGIDPTQADEALSRAATEAGTQ